QHNFQISLGTALLNLEVLDIAFVLQHLRNGHLDLRAGHRHLSLLRLLTITDAGQHIGDRIGHTHLTVLLTSSPWSCRVLHRGMPCHEVCFGTDRTYGIHHADDPSVRSDDAHEPGSHCAAVAAASDG